MSSVSRPQDHAHPSPRLVAQPLRWYESHNAQLLSRSYDVELLNVDRPDPTVTVQSSQAVGVLYRWPVGSSPAYTLRVARGASSDVAHRIPDLALGLLLGGAGAPRAVWEPLVVDGDLVEVVVMWQATA